MDFVEPRKRAKAAGQPHGQPGSAAEPAPVEASAPQPPLNGTASESERRSSPDPLAEFFHRADEDPGELADLIGEEPADEPAPDEGLQELLTFILGGEEYALELSLVREIVKVPAITEVPRTPSEVLGIMNLRGEVMPVYQVRHRLGLAPAALPLSRAARVVVVEVGEGPIGLLVDAVAEVVRIRPSTIEAPPPGIGGGLDNDCLRGIGRRHGRMFVVLNLAALLGRANPEAGDA